MSLQEHETDLNDTCFLHKQSQIPMEAYLSPQLFSNFMRQMDTTPT
jgi:hypothetical protein